MRQTIVIFLLVMTSAACSPKPETKGAARHYELHGRVVSLNTKSQTASIDGEAIPNYMEAMKMDYPVPSKQEFDRLQVGEKIKATVNVYDSGDYDLSSIEPESAGKKE